MSKLHFFLIVGIGFACWQETQSYALTGAWIYLGTSLQMRKFHEANLTYALRMLRRERKERVLENERRTRQMAHILKSKRPPRVPNRMRYYFRGGDA